MALPVLSNHFRTITTFSNIASGNPWSVTIDYDRTLETGDLSAENVADSLLVQWGLFVTTPIAPSGSIASTINSLVDLDSIRVYDLDPDPGPDAELTPGTAFGTSTFSNLPPDLAICVSKRTAGRGRRARGRIYLGGFNITASDANGFIAPGLQAAIAGGMNDHMREFEPAIGDRLTMVVISQFARGPVMPPLLPPGPILPATSFQVSSLTVDNHFDVQRRRGQG